MSVRIDINKLDILHKTEKAWQGSRAPLSEQILKDCNEYVRVDQGQLKQSSETASDFQKGILVWNTPYAKKVYYTGTPSTDVNSNASLMWCEKAKKAHVRDWEKIAQKLMIEGYR